MLNALGDVENQLGRLLDGRQIACLARVLDRVRFLNYSKLIGRKTNAPPQPPRPTANTKIIAVGRVCFCFVLDIEALQPSWVDARGLV